MRIGAMNNPAHRVVEEIEWIADLGLDFIDLTLEPPAAGHWQIDADAVAAALLRHRIGIIGHTAYYLPLGHPFEEIRIGAVAAFQACLQMFARLGARAMNIHPDFRAPMHDVAFSVRQNLKSIRELLPMARQTNITLMVENLPREMNDAAGLADFLDDVPELALHLDLGHTNIMSRDTTASTILARYGHRLRHVHLHDNRGHADDHLPLGAGTLDLRGCLGALKATGYDDTITLEVFTPDRELVRYSAEKLRRTWDQL